MNYDIILGRPLEAESSSDVYDPTFAAEEK